MGVETEGVAMFLHVALVVVGLMLAAVLHAGLVQLRRAHTTAEMRPWVPAIRRIEPLLPLVALAIFASGAWLIQLSDGEVEWGDAWIVTSIVALVLGEGVGALLSPVSKALTTGVADAQDGPVTAELRRRSLAPALWYGAHFITAVFFGIIFLMTARPEEAWACVAVVVVAGAIGLASAIPFVHEAGGRAPAPFRHGPAATGGAN